MTEVFTIFSQHGVPTLVLGFLLFYIIRPVFQAQIEQIKEQTATNKALQEEIAVMRKDINILQVDVDKIKIKTKIR